jgi:hypothetical protein
LPNLVSLSATSRLPALVAAAGERAGMRSLEFFASNTRNPHTRRAYARAADEFLAQYWRNTSPGTSTAPACEAIPRVHCSARSAAAPAS